MVEPEIEAGIFGYREIFYKRKHSSEDYLSSARLGKNESFL